VIKLKLEKIEILYKMSCKNCSKEGLLLTITGYCGNCYRVGKKVKNAQGYIVPEGSVVTLRQCLQCGSMRSYLSAENKCSDCFKK
jgi:allophanate hydrolase subunit 2